MKTNSYITTTIGALCCLAGAAFSQSYPAGPVRVIVPFPAGGGVDGMGRIRKMR